MGIQVYDVMLISPDTIKGLGELDLNVDDSVISASIRASQNIYLREIIGDKLLIKLQELIYNTINNVNDNLNDTKNEVFKVFLDTFVRDVISYKVASEMCVRNSLKIKNAGVVQLGDTNINTVSLNDIKYLKDSYDTYFNSSVNRMLDFMKTNKEFFKDFLTKEECGIENNKYGNIKLFLGK
jgi:hypothetical protein